MNATTHTPLPSPLRHSEAPLSDLDGRILLAEQRLMAREEGLHRRFGTLGLRVRQILKPRHLLMPAMAAGVALAAWLWLKRRRRATAAPGKASEPVPARIQGRAGGWASAASLVWSMLPAAWRAPVNSTAARLIFAGLPWLRRLFG